MKTKPEWATKPGHITRLDGLRFGWLLVLGRDGVIGRYVAWKCRCDCGQELRVSGDRLRRGKTKSCHRNGCRWRQDKPHGVTVLYPSEYTSWRTMHERCEDTRHKNFPNYGGRGIKICSTWSTFDNFIRDMGRKPDPKFTIERNDVNGNYEPGNCRWISRADQGRNMRSSVYVTYQGKKMLLLDVVNELGLSRSVVYGRLKNGWSLETALALPVRQVTKGGRKKPVAYCKMLVYEPLATNKGNLQK